MRSGKLGECFSGDGHSEKRLLKFPERLLGGDASGLRSKTLCLKERVHVF